jgi:4-amino-4-deoxy-L-arabinose transferase-like glycosyltransferase
MWRWVFNTRAAVLIAIVLAALALRLAPWGQNRFLEDEALYAYWGLQIATGADPMLSYEPVDKPPFHPYTLGLSFLIFGQNETAARLPSLFASVADVVIVYALGRKLYGDDRVGLLAALLLALSPFDILFASTAFTDPLMTTWVLVSLLAAAKGRLGIAGILAALAAATKQQGLFYLPLVVIVGRLSKDRFPKSGMSEAPPRLWKSGWVRFVLGFAAVAAAVLGWDGARVQRPGFVVQGLLSYGTLAAIRPEALGVRALEWLRLAGYFWASLGFDTLLVVVLVTWLIGRLLRPRLGHGLAGSPTDVVLAVFVIGFLVLHWLVGFQVWDRYLLGLVPAVALLAARALVALGQAIHGIQWRRAYSVGLVLVLVGTLTGPVVRAAHSEIPVGGDHGAYDGIDDLARYLRSQARPGSVLYHYWLGYHYRFYLYGAPLRLHWYPDLEDLAHDATVYRREPRYIAFPSWRDEAPARIALARAGLSLAPVLETIRRDGSVSFRLYRIEGP